MKKLIFFIALVFSTISLFAQPTERLIKVQVTPNNANWEYKIGEKVKFDITVIENGTPIKGIDIRYMLSIDMVTPYKTENATLTNGKLQIDAGTMQNPGFLRCRVFVDYKNNPYEGRATVAFEPTKIKPTVETPNDFVQFWQSAIEDNNKLPMDSRLKLLPERCTGKVNVYELNIQSYKFGSRIYGILCVPKEAGKYPAILNVPGAGIRPYRGGVGMAEKGFITLEIGIHGIPVTMDNVVYENLDKGALNGYHLLNWDNRDNNYFKRVYLGCVKIVDYIANMPEFDGANIIVEGGSQGGALAIVTAALNPKVTGVVAYYPGLCDLTGYLFNRAGGWPNIFENADRSSAIVAQKIKMAQYYDVVNFARLLKVPGFYSFGFNDMLCPPTSVFAAYNAITAPKNLYTIPETAHYAYPEQWLESQKWILQSVGKK